MRKWRAVSSAIMCLIFSLAYGTAFAQYTSGNYKVDETLFGTGGAQNYSSSNYQEENAAAGNLGGDRYSSANYRSEAGFISQYAPFISLLVNTSTIDLGTLSSSSTATGNGTFSVTSYLSGSYSIITMSAAPTNESGAILTGMSATAAPTVGTTQFGINLVANTSPSSFGADPANIPDNTFADGKAATGYATTNQYKYVQGDTIASSPKTAGNAAIGRTDYTISYIADISIVTPAGFYTMNHIIVAVGTF